MNKTTFPVVLTDFQIQKYTTYTATPSITKIVQKILERMVIVIQTLHQLGKKSVGPVLIIG